MRHFSSFGFVLAVLATFSAACGSGSKQPQNQGPDTQQPSDPAEPTDPTNPVDPSDPANPTEPVDVPIDPETGEPVPQDVSPEVKAEFGFSLTVPAKARVEKNGIVERCFVAYADATGAAPLAADAGAPLPPPEPPAPAADAGTVTPPDPEPTPEPVPPPAPGVPTCVKQFELYYRVFPTGTQVEYDVGLIINPADDGRNPAIVTLSTEKPDGTVTFAQNLSGGTSATGWATSAAAIRPASNGNEYQIQVNVQSGTNSVLLQSVFSLSMADFKVLPLATK